MVSDNIKCPYCGMEGEYEDDSPELDCPICGATLRTSYPVVHYWIGSNQRLDGGFNTDAACGFSASSRRPKVQKRFTTHLTDVTCRACIHTKLFHKAFEGESFLRTSPG